VKPSSTSLYNRKKATWRAEALLYIALQPQEGDVEG